MDATITITGNVGGGIEFSSSKLPVASFRLACTPRLLRGGEWTDGATTWLTVTCFRGLAEHVTSSLRKGDPVIVIGRLRTNVWTKDGVERERLVLEAASVGHDLSWGTSAFLRAPRVGRDAAGVDEAQQEELTTGSADHLATEGSVEQAGVGSIAA